MGKALKEIEVLCIGAGIEQLPVIQIAQHMGLNVTAIDGNPEAVGLQAANRGIAIDLQDTASVVKLAQEIGISCILPVPLGSILTTVGAVNDALSLRGISEAASQRCTDKILTYKILKEAGLLTPEFTEGGDRETLLKAAEKISFPVVVKPRYGSGSQGVFVARDKTELLYWLPWHLEQRKKCKAPEKSMVENFITGKEVGVDSVVIGEEHSLLAIRDKEVTELPFRLPYAHLMPTLLPEVIQKKIAKTLTTACVALGLQNCLIHADIIVRESDEVVILDISGRPSGFNISAKMIPTAKGIDPIHQAIQFGLGYPPDFTPRHHRGAVLRMFSAPKGRFKSIEGFERVRQMPGVVAFESFLKPGDIIQERRTGATGYRVGYLLTCAQTRDEADRLWQEAARKIDFCVE